MDAIWYLIGDIFQAIFKVVPFFGLFVNKILIAVGFVAFFGWVSYMSKHKEITKWD